MSELVREALRQYERRSWWDEVNAYGRRRAEEVGIGESDVERVVQEARRSARSTRRKKLG
jgi:hypothetical protein